MLSQFDYLPTLELLHIQGILQNKFTHSTEFIVSQFDDNRSADDGKMRLVRSISQVLFHLLLISHGHFCEFRSPIWYDGSDVMCVVHGYSALSARSHVRVCVSRLVE
jgi:hypothetical protein